MFRPKKTTAPVKKVWRISESAPMGEWVNEVAPATPKPSKDLPEVSSGTWVKSSYDLLDGTDVTEDPDALTAELFDELCPPRQDTTKNAQ